MVKAVIFDCFGVLVSGSLEQFISAHFAHDKGLVAKAHELNDQASLGLITYDEQLEGFAEMADLSLEQVRAEMDKNPRNEALLAYIRDNLYGVYKLGFLSNASDNWLDDLFTAEDLEMFDDFILSYNVHMAKPDVRIYELAARRLGVAVEECVFIDDIERYCEGAVEADMKAICYKDMVSFRAALKELL